MGSQAGEKSVALVCSGLREHNLRLQPWRYLSEVAQGLAHSGHPLTIISDGELSYPYQTIDGLPLFGVQSLRPLPARRHASLQRALAEIQPQVVLWNLGLSSLLYQDFSLYPGAQHAGIFTSPIYTLSELGHLGLAKLLRNRSLTTVHLFGTLLPKSYLRKRLLHSGLAALVTQTHTTRRQIEENNLWDGQIVVIAPGVDDVWRHVFPQAAWNVRGKLGFGARDCVVVYYGAPSQLRGLRTLLTAFEHARQEKPHLRLLVLSRWHPNQSGSVDKTLVQQTRNMQSAGLVRLVEGFLAPADLVLYVAAADIVALPFELVQSDAPLSILEARALGKPLVTTRVACLPELTASSPSYLAEPGDSLSLAVAIEQAVEGLSAQSGGYPANPDKLPARDWQAVGMEWSQLIRSL
jgi:glycosyltransferase involved in cell wall biosynthesis